VDGKNDNLIKIKFYKRKNVYITGNFGFICLSAIYRILLRKNDHLIKLNFLNGKNNRIAVWRF
jgi:hypothetical protein